LDLQVLGFAVNDHEQVFVLQMLWVLPELLLQVLVLRLLVLRLLVLRLLVFQLVLVLQLVQLQQLLVLVEFHHVVHLQLEH
jgi:hypothetical protein